VASALRPLSEALQLGSAGLFGLFIGALLAEGALLVPYWRSLPTSEFFALHGTFGPRLFRFFAPLTAAASLAAVAAAGASLWAASPGRWASLLSAGLAASLLATYFLYFRRANAGFAAARPGTEGLAAELARWARWHWVRVGLGLGGFACSLLALR
jgi:hypothetical protein